MFGFETKKSKYLNAQKEALICGWLAIQWNNGQYPAHLDKFEGKQLSQWLYCSNIETLNHTGAGVYNGQPVRVTVRMSKTATTYKIE